MFRLLFGCALLITCPAMSVSLEHNLMPAPASLKWNDGRFPVNAGFQVSVNTPKDERLVQALNRGLRRLEERTGLTFKRTSDGEYTPATKSEAASLVIECNSAGSAIPQLGEDESYSLEVAKAQATLRAPTALGVLRGLETFLQLVQADAGGWFIPANKIQDQPRFPWRGLMLDVCRHWQPMEVVKRSLDGMALVKLNVLHFHLTEDQGFRVESKKFPKLHELGSDGKYFTQDEIREIIAYAAARGIRVVPEFDIPGHATSWVVGYPELASAPGPYVIERKWGVFDPVLDPTNPKVYELLDGFLGEMAALFPDPYLHIGGDENNSVHWNANPAIQAFIRDHKLKDNAGLHAYFNSKLNEILQRHGKKLIGWDEILHPDLPAGSAIHSWRGPEGVAAATSRGFATVLSNGYYIDLSHPTVDHYLNDPAPAGAALTDAQRKLVLGGEATMWAEWVTPETIDSRIWPRTAAIAERLWSPQDVRDVPDMYRRLAIVSRRLEEAGMRHESYLDQAIRGLAGDGASVEELTALRSFVSLLEPVKGYQRGGQQPDFTQFTPLNGLADCARPDSAAAREFSNQVDKLIIGTKISGSSPASDAIAQQLTSWKTTADKLLARLVVQAPRLVEAKPVVQALADASVVGREALVILASGKAPAKDWCEAQLAKLNAAAKPHAAVELPAIAALKRLAAAAAEQDKRATFSDEAWKKHLTDLVAPPASSSPSAH